MELTSLYTKRYGKAFAKQTIESYMVKQKIDSVDNFLKKNPTVVDFDQNSKLVNIIRTHGYYILNEKEYQDILQEIKLEEEQRKKLDTDAIEKTAVNGKEIVTYTDKETNQQIILDNSISNRSFENQMKDIQKDNKQLSLKKTNNTLNVVNYMKKYIKIEPKIKDINNIGTNNLSHDETLILETVKAFEKELGHSVKVDLNSKILYDNGVLYSIEKSGENYVIVSQDKKDKEINNKSKGRQLVKKINDHRIAS